MRITRGGSVDLTKLEEIAESQNDLLLELLLEQKIDTLHLAEVSGEVFDQEDVELETN